MRPAIIVFPGSNCDQDILHSIKNIYGKAPKLIWYQETIPNKTDFIIIPGGFSFGDYLRSGAIASSSNIIREVISFSKKGTPIMGICNGFQILTEANLLPGTLIINNNLKFICKDIYLKVINKNCIFTHKLNNTVLKLPIAHKMGNYVATKDVLKKITANDQIVFKYCSEDGNIDDKYNPNGSISNIAGILSLNKRILGMMPHPERYTDMKQKDIIMEQMIGSIS